ncbi:MAG: transcriptional regulator [Propionibacteriales bacterium]|nr:transcriptional regulator [Propionibacteriales bacterium]
MAATRSYGDPCAVARALDLIGERWAMMIIRELLFGPKRYSDLHIGLPHASPTVLSQRLRELEGGEVIRRRKVGPPTRAWVYELTDWGHQLEPILVHLGRWGRGAPTKQTTTSLSTDSLMLALQSHLEPSRLQGLDATVLIDLGEDLFTIRVADGDLTIRRGEPERSDVAVQTDTANFTALVIGRCPLGELGDGVQVSGDHEAFDRLLDALVAA